MKILYFASLREQLGQTDEVIDADQLDGIGTVGDLKRFLSQRGESWQVLNALSTRAAVNQQVVSDDSDLQFDDEVAFFPPVTGG